MPMPATLLVIPCYCERERLPHFLPGLCEALRDEAGLRVRVVDDGSGPEQQQWLADYVDRLRAEFRFLDFAQLNPQNLGKGGAIYSGWDRPGSADLLAFADADGAVPAEEILRLLRQAASQPNGAVYAVRTGGSGTRVNRSFHRRLAGSVFRWLVRCLFRFPVPDTQCGFKVIPAAPFAALRPALQEARFTFDVELTWHLLQRGVAIEAVAINWTESPGSRLGAGSAWNMFRSLLSLRRRLGDWRNG